MVQTSKTMSCDDKEEQELEVVALTSIYEDNDQLLFAQEGQEPGGVFMAAQTPSQPFYVCVGKPGDSGDPDEGMPGILCYFGCYEVVQNVFPLNEWL